MQCVNYEIWASREQRQGSTVVAGAYKRAARLSLQSVQRWVRSSGELWIIKNRFDPAARHGFETYSHHSQYNLLTAATLATAWLFSDDSIAERATPADTGGFVIHLQEFHKIIANASGLYVQLETGADPRYDSTGLLMVHCGGVDSLVGPSDGGGTRFQQLALGIAWQERGCWRSLAGLQKNDLKSVTVVELESRAECVRFQVRYHLDRSAIRSITETYELGCGRLCVTSEVEGKPARLKACLPVLAFDGQEASEIALQSNTATVSRGHSRAIFTVEFPANVTLERAPGQVSSRNGYIEEIYGEVEGKRVVYSLQFRTHDSEFINPALGTASAASAALSERPSAEVRRVSR